MSVKKEESNSVGAVTLQNQSGKGRGKTDPIVPTIYRTFNPYKQLSHNFMIPTGLVKLGISPRGREVYGCLRKYAGENGKCFVSIKRVSEDLDVHKRTIDRGVKELSDAKLIRRFVPGNNSNVAHTEFLIPEGVDPSDFLCDEVRKDSVRYTTKVSLTSDMSLTHDKNVVNPTTKVSLTHDKNVAQIGLVKKGQLKDSEKDLCVIAAASSSSDSKNITSTSSNSMNGKVARFFAESKPEEKPTQKEAENDKTPVSDEIEAEDDKPYVNAVDVILKTKNCFDLIPLFMKTHPRIINPKESEDAIYDWLETCDSVGAVIHAYTCLEVYALAVKDLRECSEAWIYVVGSKTWFTEKRWLTETPHDWLGWAAAKKKQHSLVCS